MLKPLTLEQIETMVEFAGKKHMPTREGVIALLETARLAMKCVKAADLLEIQTRLPADPIHDFALINILREALSPFRQARGEK